LRFRRRTAFFSLIRRNSLLDTNQRRRRTSLMTLDFDTSFRNRLINCSFDSFGRFLTFTRTNHLILRIFYGLNHARLTEGQASGCLMNVLFVMVRATARVIKCYWLRPEYIKWMQSLKSHNESKNHQKLKLFSLVPLHSPGLGYPPFLQ
jgi:hypothetical protein